MKKRSFAIGLMMMSAGLLFVFQNCARPEGVSRPDFSELNSGLETESQPEAILPPAPNSGPALVGQAGPLFSALKKAGTNNNEMIRHLINTSDGGFLSTGETMTDSSSNSRDVLLQKWDREGDLEYSVVIGDQYNNNAFKVIETPNLYIVGGLTYSVRSDETSSRSSNLLIMQIDKSNGDIIYSGRIGGPNFESLRDLRLSGGTFNPRLIAVGRWSKPRKSDDTLSSNPFNALAVEFDLSLNITWQRRFTKLNSDLGLNSVVHVPGRGYYAVGHQRRAGRYLDSLIMRINEGGTLIKTMRFNNNLGDTLYSIEHSGVDLIAVGQFGNRASFVRLDYDLNLKSVKLFGGNAQVDLFHTVRTTRDGGLIFAGTTNSFNASEGKDLWTVKVDQNDSVQFSKVYGSGSRDESDSHSLVVRPDGGYAFVGSGLDVNGSLSPYLYLTDQYGDLPGSCSQGYRGELNIGPPEGVDAQPQTINGVVSNSTNFTMESVMNGDASSFDYEPNREFYCTP